VLGLEKGATQEEIRAKYRELTKLWHPDKVSQLPVYRKHSKEKSYDSVTVVSTFSRLTIPIRLINV
jgi:DnaJ-class molecular chaperone